MRRMPIIALLGAVMLLAGISGAQAASRGLNVELRASETKGTPVADTVKLYGSSHALVIGNDAYTGAWPLLSNAVKDARLIAETLRAKGFEVTLLTDLKSAELIEAFEKFFYETGADPDARLFLWYAGHGYSEAGEGYLVPVDAPDSDEGYKFLRKALSLRRMGEYTRGARALHILSVFDSCFAGTVFNVGRAKPPPAITRATTRPVRQFLTSGDAGQQVSDDGAFRKLFIRAINGENRADTNRDGYLAATELGLFMADQITNYSNGTQTPRNGKLNDQDLDRGDFIFQVKATVTIRVTAPPPTSDGQSAEMLFWQSIKDSKDAEDFGDYVAQYPNGAFASLAKRRIAKLEEQKTAALTPPKVTMPSPATPAVGVYPARRKPGEVFQDCATCPEMVVIPPGRFQMGDLNGSGAVDERPVHDVRIGYRVAVGKFAVTRGEYAAFVNATGRGTGDGCQYFTGRKWERGGSKSWRDTGFSQTDRDPVVCVSWDDAKEYVSWLNRETGQSYRLLSESEWEYVARANSTTKYNWGNDPSGNKAVCDRCGSQWDNKRTAPVGSFSANSFGLYDVHGNVWEWVEDCWHDSYSGSPTNGASWISGGKCRQRVVRGGSWSARPKHLRVANRGWSNTDYQSSGLGFRVVRTLSQ